MSIVHLHIERTGGVSLQDLYEHKFGGERMLWYSTRDDLFAPFGIKTANYTSGWQLNAYALIARRFPSIRSQMVERRTKLRAERAVPEKELATRADIIIGHFAVDRVIEHLPPDSHEYRTVVRDPLARMWSHFCHWQAHRGDVGQRVVPPYDENMIFEEFALLPPMHDYQTQAMGPDPSVFSRIGTTEKLSVFALATGLINPNMQVPSVNHFGGVMPPLSEAFLSEFRDANAGDYRLHQNSSI